MSHASLDTAHGRLDLPAFLPDATHASLRTLEAGAAPALGIEALMVNALHVSRSPGVRTIRHLGGLHRFMAFSGPIVTDSGGFQILSRIRRDPRTGAIRRNDVVFHDEEGAGKLVLTPRKCIDIQLRLGSDFVIALDDCTMPEAPASEQEESVERTIRWFLESKRAFDQGSALFADKGPPPLLAGVVQGGTDERLRRRCVEALVENGASGFGFGGWPVDESGRFLIETFAFVRKLLPEGAPLFALGIGKPENLVRASQVSKETLFDCTIPTREARHGRLYVFDPDPPASALDPDRPFYRTLNILLRSFASKGDPPSLGCDCPTCRSYSLAYLHHLFAVKDALGERLATVHNLRFYARLVAHLRVQR